ncbi:4-(hydroxymethyl)benzenesulfonate dehydrogenase [hydrothermal vent metagenome]|uniref:4-(Hydroxymethyl)benzenesulfonate dehydrogenase n=1 Tax=hydrothermal vent metagenome TaxID=652676 RepID=A0A3B0TIG9_9ZZZZ
MRLKGKTAIVTGGASGFGQGIVRKFVAEGAKVLICDINGDGAAALAAELGENTLSHRADISISHNVSAMVAKAIMELGHVDIMVNNAGVTHRPGELENIEEKEFDRVMAINVKSVFLTSKYVVPHMKGRKKGVVLNVASTAGVSPRPNLSWYNASKGWMITATKSMAIELASVGIRVNAINPVAGETPLLKTFMGADTPEIRAKFLATIPIGRFSQPEDMGNAACFLCSDEASMITGVALEVDGGRCI